MVTERHLEEGRVYPPLSDIREVSTKLATQIIDYAYKKDLAFAYPEPKDKRAFVEENQYNAHYDSLVPPTYSWPGMQEE